MLYHYVWHYLYKIDLFFHSICSHYQQHTEKFVHSGMSHKQFHANLKFYISTWQLIIVMIQYIMWTIHI
jgi:hypothetical protein